MQPNYTLRRIMALALIALTAWLIYLWANTPDPGPCHFEGANCIYTVQDL